MKITKLSLIEEMETHYIFTVSFKSFFGAEKERTAIKEKPDRIPKWMNTGNLVYNNEGIDAWVSTDKKDFIL